MKMKIGNKIPAVITKSKGKRISLFTTKQNQLHSQTCKKDLSGPMAKTASVSDVENGWYEWWQANNFFRRTEAKPKFVMLLPPPNITGDLHMGHAITCAVQDAIVRWNQMKGNNVLWVPGCDHAGIATQVVVERNLLKQKKVTKDVLGREKFTDEIWKWKVEKEKKIFSQMKRMGVSLQWDQSYFTLDKKVCEGVIEAFIRLFDEGLIYRGKYMINWCCALQSAISDFEVEMLDIDRPTKLSIPGHAKPVQFGYTYNIHYRLSDSDELLTVSTTRPETILGDTGLMVNPDDPRFTSFHGRKVVHPFRGDHIPVVADAHVSKDKGTGVVKVTPGHSSTDYEVGQRHDLPVINMLDDRGRITGFGEFDNQPRFAVREAILDALASKGLFEHKMPHEMQLPRCMRTGDVIEPRLKDQWFLATEGMTNAALRAVEESRLRFHPPEFSKVWNHFLSNQRDWCISRQLWWGHRIPVYWVSTRQDSSFGSDAEVRERCSTFVASASEEAAVRQAAEKLGVEESSVKVIKQEDDVLDTWFSSSLLPFVVFGWPKNTAALDSCFPLSLMETGHDILFFWVGRMVMMGLKLVDKLPFNDVLLHGLMCDSKGHKMSKSKGNVIDPLHVIDGNAESETKKQGSFPAYGADALRLAICSLNIKKRIIILDMANVRQRCLFRNKVWQTLRFLLQNIKEIPDSQLYMKHIDVRRTNCVMDKWLMSKLARMVSEYHEGFATYDLYLSAHAVSEFWLGDLCDIYLEACKRRLWGHATSPETARECLMVLWSSIHTSLLALSPFMPFLTEELYGHLPSLHPKHESISQCSFPNPEEYDGFRDSVLEEQMDQILLATAALRNLRKSYDNAKYEKGKGSICISNDTLREVCATIAPEIQRISFLSEVEIQAHDDAAEVDPGFVVDPVCEGISVRLQIQGLVDPEVAIPRVEKQLLKVEKDLKGAKEKALRNEANNITPTVEDKVKLGELEKDVSKFTIVLQNLKKLR